MLFISDVQYYVPVKLCKTAGSIHLFKVTGKVTPDKVNLNRHYIWDILEIDWSKINVTFNGKVINLPKYITVKLWDKFKVRHMMESQPILFDLMLKRGFNWFTLTSKYQETESVKLNQFNIREMAREISLVCHFICGSICTSLLTDTVDVELSIKTVKGIYTYHKDHTVELTIFTLWSKSVIPFPSLRHKNASISG